MTIIGRLWAVKSEKLTAASSFDLLQYLNKTYRGNNQNIDNPWHHRLVLWLFWIHATITSVLDCAAHTLTHCNQSKTITILREPESRFYEHKINRE